MKVLLVHNGLASFVRTDLELLRTAHAVREVCFDHRPGRLAISLAAVLRGVATCDAVVAWFGGFHALAAFLPARLLNRRRIVIASGYDVANVPAIDYGNMRPGPRRAMGNLVFRLAERILAVSHFTAGELRHNTTADPAKIQVVPHGFELPPAPDWMRKMARVVMVSGDLSQSNIRRKRPDLFIRVASALPEAEFVLIGPSSGSEAARALLLQAPPNLVLAGYVPDAHRSQWIARAKVYVQISQYESFGCALAEAMAQCCVPVVSRCGSLPEVVGETGFFATFGDEASTVTAIRQALAAPIQAGERARSRIAEHYPLEQRRQALLAALRGE